MSCFISSAVCCSLFTASMSGVALGYNYSLAEYIDLKETNVSVYLKRGIFDDEIADDMDWRRRGHQPVAGHLRDSNLITGSDDSLTTLRSGRRLDDSIYESNDRNNFEGSLMRLTAKAPDPSIITTTEGIAIHEIVSQYSPGSNDVLKAVQGAINARKAAAIAARQMSKGNQQVQPPESELRYIEQSEPNRRRIMKNEGPPFEMPSTPNPLRLAVPDDRVNELSKRRLQKLPPEPINSYYSDNVLSYSYPSVVTQWSAPVRPTKPKTRTRPTLSTTPQPPSRSFEPKLPKSIDEEMDTYKKKLMNDNFDVSGENDDEFLKKIKTGIKYPPVDYEEEIKGIPIRRKRQNILTSDVKGSANEYMLNNFMKESVFIGKITNLLKSMNRGSSFISKSTVTGSPNQYMEKEGSDKVSLTTSRNVAFSNTLWKLTFTAVIS